MHQFKQKVAVALLLSACTMHLQAWDINFSVNGNDIITPAVEQLKKAPSAVGTGIEQMLSPIDTIFEALHTAYIPLLSQYKDGNMHTFHFRAFDVAHAGMIGLFSIPCFTEAYDQYKKSKIFNSEEHKAKAYMALVGGLACVGYAGLLLNSFSLTETTIASV